MNLLTISNNSCLEGKFSTITVDITVGSVVLNDFGSEEI